MVASDTVRQRMESSMFVKLNSSGRACEEHYVAHIKVWEAAQGERRKKSRYIVLSQASDGSGFIHKVKLNCNNTFSIGKTWKLEFLREIEVMNSEVFEITPSATTYRWQADNGRDLAMFLTSMIKLFQFVTGGSAPLKLIGVKLPDDLLPSPEQPVPPYKQILVHRTAISEPTKQLDNAAQVVTPPPSPVIKPGPPVVIWKRPLDVTQIPPIPPTPAALRPD
ncbi:hypothetical protein WOLCODRAFT_148347 [Wolfiporia cocos MD-104 SS10]|uniref:Exocyst complex component Sec3 PIP2-binding N-terminal domain-containing protein n=1 Tax=Wolfiporia cocos (strain MD-104) TaxID=742152 RepID=A0A2H3J3C6_WOLCO|nr:hypothetical protein WOLCODRAFT_148347 [Wolfiporia cocos MD-104 SS10]